MDKESDVTVYEFTITKNQLMDIDERERMFFMLLGFACNEIIILYKIALAIDVFNKETEGIEKKAHAVQGSFVARLLIAKMFEGWSKLFKQLFFRSSFRREYERMFSPKAKESLDTLGKFFAENGYVATLRNAYAFHYPSSQLNDAMPNIPDHDDWTIYISESQGNSLYYLSEMVALHAMISEVDSDEAVGYDKMMADRDHVARHIIDLSTGCMNVFIKRRLGLSMEDATPITVKVPDLLDVELPFCARGVPTAF